MEVGGIIESNWDEVVDNFDSMNLKEKLLRGIYAYGFEKPSAIQQRAIIPCIKGRDVIAQAQSGKKTPDINSRSRLTVSSVLRYRKDRNFLDRHLADDRYRGPRLPSPRLGPDSRVGHPDPEGRRCLGRLHERPIPRLHRWDQRP